MSSRIRTVLAIVLAALVAVPAGAAAADRPAYKNPHLPVRERVADLLSRMTLEEKVGQMTQTERERVFEQRDADHHLEARAASCPAAAPAPTQNTPRPGPTWSTASSGRRSRTRLRHPDAVRRSTPCTGTATLLGATVFPHNIGLGATRDPELVERDRAHHRRGDPRDRAAVDVRAVHLRRPRRPLGPDVRELRREPGARDPHGDRDRRLSRARRGDLADRDRVLATAKHYAGDGDTEYGTAAGDYTIDQGIAITSRADFWRRSPARRTCRPCSEHRVGHRDAVVLERRLDRGRRRQPDQDAREPGADHRRAQGRDRLRRVRDQRLGGHPPDPRRLADAGAHRRERRHRHDHGAEHSERGTRPSSPR